MNEKEYYNLIKPYEDAMQMLLSQVRSHLRGED